MLIRNLSGRMMMKLKKAVKLARASWVAVNGDGSIYAYSDLPTVDGVVWSSRASGVGTEDYIGEYTGKKHWTRTLRSAQP